MESVYVPVNPHEKAMQRALMQYRLPVNRKLVFEALRKAGREDLIGFSEKCLLRPEHNNKIKPTVKTPEKKKKTIRNVHKKRK